MIVVPYAHGMCSVVIPYDLVTSFGLILTRVESSGGTWFGPARRGGLFPPHRPRPKADFLSLSRAPARFPGCISETVGVSLVRHFSPFPVSARLLAPPPRPVAVVVMEEENGLAEQTKLPELKLGNFSPRCTDPRTGFVLHL